MKKIAGDSFTVVQMTGDEAKAGCMPSSQGTSTGKVEED